MPFVHKPDIVPGKRKCTKCLFVKPLQAYYHQQGGYLGHASICKACSNKTKSEWTKNNPERAFNHRQTSYQRWRLDPDRVERQNAANRRRASSYTATHRRTYLRNTYGITPEQYDQMYAAQDGKCAICSTHRRRLCIDHNHDTGAIRQLLCNGCNTAIGHLREDTGILRSAIEYLERHNAPTQQ